MSTSGNLDEVVATGDLFKQARRQLTNWTLRKFLLSGITLTYFDSGGFIKGKIDIRYLEWIVDTLLKLKFKV